MRVADEYKVPLTLKLEVWEADAAMLARTEPGPAAARPAGRGDHPSRGGSKSGSPSSLIPEPPLQRQHRPEHDEHRQHQRGGDDRRRDGAEEDVGDEHDRAGHRQRQHREAGDREPVGDEDQPPLLLVAEGQPVVGRRRDQQRRRERRQQQRREVGLLVEFADRGEVLLERHREQEGEQHLHPRQRDPQLLQQLAEVAVEPFVFGLVAPRRPPLRVASSIPRVFSISSPSGIVRPYARPADQTHIRRRRARSSALLVAGCGGTKNHTWQGEFTERLEGCHRR